MGIEGLLNRHKSDLERVEKEILSHLHTEIPLLNDVAAHILSSGGKRMRPVILLMAARMFGQANQGPVQAAAAVEFLHTATLLHDDVVDDTDLRRQAKTAKAVWGNSASVLVGDYLLALSFRMLTALNDLDALDTISHTTGMMAKGEILQLIRKAETASQADYMDIIICKTASLFAAAARIGGCCGQAGEEDKEALYQYGHHLGIGFQMVDDALDYSPDRSKVGKPLGTDLKEKKVTLPLSRLMEVAEGADKERLVAILRLEEIGDSQVAEVVEMMGRYDVYAYTLGEASRYIDLAKGHLAKLPAGPERQTLEEMAGFVVSRNY